MMNPDESDSFLSAATALAGLPLAAVDYKPFDLGRLGEKGVHAGLSGALKRVKKDNRLPLTDADKYIIFSDHHKGTRAGNDDFQFCEETYGRALEFYLKEGYTLVILGDAEECWEDKAEDVVKAYFGILKLEAEFHNKEPNKRYVRVSGNHDAIWESEEMVEKHLSPIFPGLRVHEGIVFNYQSSDKHTGDLFLVHGHQGTLDSELFKPLSEALVRTFYRPYQQITGGGRTTPATNIALRAAHDTQIYRWAKKQRGLIVIAGHTHRPVWGSRTHLEKLVGEMYQLLAPPELKDQDPPATGYQIPWDEVKSKVKEIKEREYKYPSGGDSFKSDPCYFNTGCCRFKDGDITGIELADGEIRLIRWGKVVQDPENRFLERMPLTSVFRILELTRSGVWELSKKGKAETPQAPDEESADW